MDRVSISRFAAVSTAVGVALFAAYALIGRVWPSSVVLTFGLEDGLVEDATALLWAAASLVCVVRLVRGQRTSRLLLALWAVLTFVFLGEEVSWFQRILGYATPADVVDANTQGEFNLHNLRGIGPQGTLQYLFLLGFAAWFLAIPLAVRRSAAAGRVAGRVGYVPPHGSFLAMVWIVFAASYAFQVLGGEPAHHVIAETRELLYAFSVFAYLWLYLRPAPAPGRIDTPGPAWTRRIEQEGHRKGSSPSRG